MAKPKHFPYHAITVVFGPDRDAAFDEATAHFDDNDKPWLRRLDATGRDEQETLDLLRSFIPTGLDQVAVRNPGPWVLDRLVTLAETGHSVVCTMDVADLDEARAHLLAAAGYPTTSAVLALTDAS